MTSSGQGQPKKKNINEKEITEFFIAVEGHNKSGRHFKLSKKISYNNININININYFNLERMKF